MKLQGKIIDGDKVEGPYTGYHLRERIRAEKLTLPFRLTTELGIQMGRPGDYICEGPNRQRWAMPGELFESVFLIGRDMLDNRTAEPKGD